MRYVRVVIILQKRRTRSCAIVSFAMAVGLLGGCGDSTEQGPGYTPFGELDEQPPPRVKTVAGTPIAGAIVEPGGPPASKRPPAPNRAKPGVTYVFDQEGLHDGVRSILVDKYNIEKVESVSCPANQKVEVDGQFACVVVIKGEETRVGITVRSDTGEFEVAPPTGM